MVDLARLARLEDEADAGPRALAEEVVLDGREGEERRDRGVRLVVAAVGEDQDVVPLGDRLAAPPPQVLDRLPEPLPAVAAP